MTRRPTLFETATFITEAHAGQTTADGQPYYMHPMAVRNILIGWYPQASEEVQQAALLHDVVEDTQYTLDMLEDLGYSPRTLFLVKMLSRKRKIKRAGKFDDVSFEGLTYAQWIDALIRTGDLELMLLKMADLHHNMDPARIKTLPPEKQSIVERYRRAFNKLNKAWMELQP